MRLSTPQIQAIVAATAELAGPDAQVRLFGSRLDNTLLRGGDIDLLVECQNKVARPVDSAVGLLSGFSIRPDSSVGLS